MGISGHSEVPPSLSLISNSRELENIRYTEKAADRDDMMSTMETAEWRQKIFKRLWERGTAKAADEKLRTIKAPMFREAKGVVLELGPGTGANFRYFPADISWIGVEPVEAWHATLRSRPDHPHEMRFSSTLGEVPTASVDTVVSSLVLCSVPNLRETLADIRRVLKPGGQFLCVEHVAAPCGTLRRILQYFILPFTKTLGGGCDPVRDIAEAIARAGFSEHNITAHAVPLGCLPFPVPIIVCRARA